jgi:hypothetical protein
VRNWRNCQVHPGLALFVVNGSVSFAGSTLDARMPVSCSDPGGKTVRQIFKSRKYAPGGIGAFFVWRQNEGAGLFVLLFDGLSREQKRDHDAEHTNYDSRNDTPNVEPCVATVNF